MKMRHILSLMATAKYLRVNNYDNFLYQDDVVDELRAEAERIGGTFEKLDEDEEGNWHEFQFSRRPEYCRDYFLEDFPFSLPSYDAFFS